MKSAWNSASIGISYEAFRRFWKFFIFYHFPEKEGSRGGVKSPFFWLKIFFWAFHDICAQKKKANQILKKVQNMVHPIERIQLFPRLSSFKLFNPLNASSLRTSNAFLQTCNLSEQQSIKMWLLISMKFTKLVLYFTTST